jgi:RNA polymerase sigma-70 factor, ECF subfamily
MFTQKALTDETIKLQKFSLRLTKHKADADDLLQSTCLRALEKAHLFEEGTNLFGWTSKIMYNLFISNCRRRSNFESQSDPEVCISRQAVAPTQDIESEFKNVKRAMAQLNDDHREILIMIGVQGMSYDEASKELHIPVGTVRSRLSRAREQLQTVLEKPSLRAVPRIAVPEQSANNNIPKIPAFIAARAIHKRWECR